MLVLYWFIRKSKNFQDRYDGIVFAVFVSLGFALVENCMYVLDGGHGVAVVRFLFSVPGHGLWGVVMGYFYTMAKFSEANCKKYYWLSLIVPILLHGTYDFCLMYIDFNPRMLPVFICLLSFFTLMFVVWNVAIKQIKTLRDEDMTKNENIEQAVDELSG